MCDSWNKNCYNFSRSFDVYLYIIWGTFSCSKPCVWLLFWYWYLRNSPRLCETNVQCPALSGDCDVDTTPIPMSLGIIMELCWHVQQKTFTLFCRLQSRALPIFNLTVRNLKCGYMFWPIHKVGSVTLWMN